MASEGWSLSLSGGMPWWRWRPLCHNGGFWLWDTVWFLFSSCLLIKKDIPNKKEKRVNNCGPGDSKYFRKSTSSQMFSYLLRYLILVSAIRIQLKKKKKKERLDFFFLKLRFLSLFLFLVTPVVRGSSQVRIEPAPQENFSCSSDNTGSFIGWVTS